MVKHVILWQLKDSFTEEEKTEIKAGIKAGLEGLAGQIPGLLSIQVCRCSFPERLFCTSGPCDGCGRQGAPEREMPRVHGL